MPISTSEIIKMLCDLSEEEGIKVTVTESFKGGLLTGAAAFIGGCLLGPGGLASGGIIGGLASYYVNYGKFQSVGQVIMKMEQSRKELLASRVRDIFAELNYTDLIQITIIMAQPQIKQRLVQEIVNFCQSQLKMDAIC